MTKLSLRKLLKITRLVSNWKGNWCILIYKFVKLHALNVYSIFSVIA